MDGRVPVGACARRGGGLLVGVTLPFISLLPFVIGGYASRATGRARLLFGGCLVLFFVGFAVRAFLFFDHVQARFQGRGDIGDALVVLVGEPLASSTVVVLLWGLCRASE